MNHTIKISTKATKQIFNNNLRLNNNQFYTPCFKRLFSKTTFPQKSDDKRVETDSFGEILVDNEKYWGAQTQRSFQNFKVGGVRETFPFEFIEAFALVKLSTAKVNNKVGLLSDSNYLLIKEACEDIINKKINPENFPLVVWQTGSGTQTNMNLNEVISNRAIQLSKNKMGSKKPVHPNDHVNLGQSSNDTFPTVMHVSTALQCLNKLLPNLELLIKGIKKLKEKFKNENIIKIGRTHMQDATPLSLDQEFSAFEHMLQNNYETIQHSLNNVMYLAQGGTAVGTGLNSFVGFDKMFCEQLSSLTKKDFKPAKNKFEALSCNDALVNFSGSLNTLACSLMKIGNDIRLLSCGPRCGFGELSLPENEPGSSIMPGKVNPTQIEMLTMVCCQVMGNHTAVTIGGSNGHLQLNVYRPMIISNVLRSITLLSDGIKGFNENCILGIEPNKERIRDLMNKSLMLVTALNPHIGYDNAAKIAKYAHKNNTTLKEAAQKLKILNQEEFDKLVDPENMIGPYNLSKK